MTQYLKVAEIAAELRVSKMTVYRLVNDGELSHTRVGRSFRVTREAIDEYLQRNSFGVVNVDTATDPGSSGQLSSISTVDGGAPA